MRRSPPQDETTAPGVSSKPAPEAGLYQRLLGDSWHNVDPAVRRLHLEGTELHAQGVFHVRHGSGWLPRLLIRAMSLPAADEAAPVRLIITRIGRGERWHRTFGGRPMVSTQVERAGRTLGERVGLTEVRFRLRVVDGALHYDTVGGALCIGPLTVPLPRWLAPGVTAREAPAGSGGTHVSVAIYLPGGGLLISYEGRIKRVEEPQ